MKAHTDRERAGGRRARGRRNGHQGKSERRPLLLYTNKAKLVGLGPLSSLGIRGNPKDVDFFVMQDESRRAVSSTTLRLLC